VAGTSPSWWDQAGTLLSNAARTAGGAVSSTVNAIREFAGGAPVGPQPQPTDELTPEQRIARAHAINDPLERAKALAAIDEENAGGVRGWLGERLNVDTVGLARQERIRQTDAKVDAHVSAAKDIVAQGGKDGWMSYITENPSMLLLPLGALFAASGWGGNTGRILGTLAAVFGGGEMMARYAALKDPASVSGMLEAYQQMKAGKLPQAEFMQKHGPLFNDFKRFANDKAIDAQAQTIKERARTVAPAQPATPENPPPS